MKITHEEVKNFITNRMESNPNNKLELDYIAQQQEFEAKVKRYFELEKILDNNGKTHCYASDLVEFFRLKAELKTQLGFYEEGKK